MSNNYLDQKNLARLAEINKTQTKQMEQFLFMNPNFQNRFEAINNMYSNLPLDIVIDLSMFSEQELPVESESIVTLNNTIIEEQAIQAANDYQQSKEDYRDKDYADNMTMNYLDVLSFGAVSSSLYWAQRMAFGKNYNPEGGIIDTPIGAIDVTPSAPNFGKTQTLVLLAETFNAASEIFVKYSPSFRSSIQKPTLRRDEEAKARGEFGVEVVPGSQEFKDLTFIEKNAMAIPGVNLLVPGNRALFNGRVLAYAQQMNALDRFMESGKTREFAQQYVPIDFAKSKISDLGVEGNWKEETKQWVRYAKEGRKVGGRPAIAQIMEEIYKGRPVNYNRDNLIVAESLFAEDSPVVQDMVNKGYSFEFASKMFYEDVGKPIYGNDVAEIPWTAIQTPNEIEAFAGRQFIYTPEAAEQYEQTRVRNNNELFGVKIPYSSGRYQASLLYDVGSSEYNQLSGFIDGAERIVPELVLQRGFSFARKLKNLRNDVNALSRIDDASLWSQDKKVSMIQDFVKKEKVNPVTNVPIENVDEFLQTFDYTTSLRKFTPDLKTDLKSVKKQSAKYFRDYGLFGGRAPGFLTTTGPKIVNRLEKNGNLSKYAAETSEYKIATDAFLGKFPEAVQKEIVRINNVDEMSKLFNKIYSDAGLTLPKMSDPFKQMSSPIKGSNYLTAGINAVTGKNVSVPSFGSLMGRTANKGLQIADNAVRKPGAIYRSLRQPQINMQLTDVNKTLGKQEFARWTKTGQQNLSRNMGFFHEFTDGMSPYWRKWFSVQPGGNLSYSNRSKAYTTLVRHLANIGYGDKQASEIIREFHNIKKWNVQTVNAFASKLRQQDVLYVTGRKGTERSKILQRRIDDMFNDEGRVKNYLIDPTGRQIDTQWSGRSISEEGIVNFLPTISKMGEAADAGASLINNRAIQRTLGRFFTDMPDAFISSQADYVTPEALAQMAKNIKEQGFFKGLKIPSRKIEEDVFTYMADFYTNQLFKPKAILKPSLTQRVLLEEQLGFFVHPDLDSVFSHPIDFMNWIYSYGQLPKRAPLRKLMEQIVESGEDVNEITMGVLYRDALQVNFAKNGFNTSNMIDKNSINYVPISADNPKVLGGYIFEHLKLRNTPMSRVVARLGWSDELMDWADSPTGLITVDGIEVQFPPAAKLIEEFIENTGDTYADLRNRDNLMDYLSQLEAEIRFRTGMPTQEGVHYGKYLSGPKEGTDWFDNSFAYTGNATLRESIWTGVIKSGDREIALAPSYDDVFANFGSRLRKKMTNAFKEQINLVDEAGDKLYDYGSALRPDTDVTWRKGEALEKIDYFVNAQFEFLLTQPLARLHRAPIFKQYRWLRLTSHFDTFTPAVQAEFIKEAVAAKIPQKIINQLKGIKKIKSGTNDNYELWSKEASSYALATMKEILYDSSERHRFSEVTRNIFPFPEIYFELGKRWSKLTMQNPYFVREAGLVPRVATSMNGAFIYSGNGVFQKNEQNGETMFVMPGSNSFNNFLFGEDSNFNLVMKGFASGINMIASQGFPNVTPMTGIGAKWVFDKLPGSVELTDEFFGDFPPPEGFMDALTFADTPWLEKTYAGLKDSKFGIDLIRETFSDTYLDEDLELKNMTMDSAVENMRADSTITVFDGIKSTHSELKLLETGELDKYIRDIFSDWNGKRELFLGGNVDNYYNEYLQTGGKALDVPLGELTPAVLDLAIMRYSAHQGRWLNLFRGASQFGFITGAMFELTLKNNNGKWFGVTTLAKEHRNLVNKHGGDYRAAGLEFFNTFGIDHGYLTQTKKKREVETISYDAKTIQWKKDNADKLKRFQNTLQYLQFDNVLAEPSWQDVVDKATLRPDLYLPNANNAAAWVMKRNFDDQVDSNTNLSADEKQYMKTNYALALMDIKPGYKAEFGQTDTPSTSTRFKEMVDVWRTDSFAQSTEAGQGFKYFYESAWVQAEELSLQNGYSKNYWRTSESDLAIVLRKQVIKQAYYTISQYPDFYVPYVGVILRLLSDDSETMNYNTDLYTRKIDSGTQDFEPEVIDYELDN